MKKIINFVTIILTYFYFASNSYASNNFAPPIMPQLEASDSQTGFKMARAYWLPDYTYGTATISDNGNNTQTDSCSYYGQKTSIPLNKTCTKTTPAIGLTCYRDCYCSDKYQYRTCPSGKMLSTDCCDERCSSCDECTTTGNWSYTKQNVEKSRIKTTTQTCGDVFFACELGFKPMDHSILGDIGNLKTCPEHQAITISTDGENCAKCSNKPCSEFGYQDKETSNKICTVVNPYTGKNCYSCKECGTEYKYNASNCPAPNTLSGSNCGGKHTECTIVETCSPLANQTNCSSGTYSCSNGCDGTRICCDNCETEQRKLLETINSGKKGVITVEHDIRFCKNVGIVLQDGQSLAGKNGLKQKLTFNFDSPEKAVGIELGNNSNLSNLSIDYTSLNKNNKYDFHAIRNNKKKGTNLKDIDITVKNDEISEHAMAGIGNFGTMYLQGIIDIYTVQPIGRYVSGISGYHKFPYQGTLIQDKDSTLNIQSSGNGINWGINTLAGIVNIKTKGMSEYGIKAGNIILSGTTNIQTSGQYAHGILGGEYDIPGTLNIKIKGPQTQAISGGSQNITGTVNIQVDSSWGYAISTGITTILGTVNIKNNKYYGSTLASIHVTPTGTLLISTPKLAVTSYNSGTYYVPGATIGLNTNSDKPSGLWQAKTTGELPYFGFTLDKSPDFNLIGEFPQQPDIPDIIF